MKYFIDTEFIQAGAGQPIELLSFGMVCEDDRRYYMENMDADLTNANDWVKEHVISQFDFRDSAHEQDLRLNLLDLVGDDPNPEFWGWCCDYDYVVVSQNVGFDSWPNHWPYYFRDIQQEADRLGVKLTGGNGHNALEDAEEIKSLYESLIG